MIAKSPLLLHLLAHPKSESAKAVATALMHRFVEPPASGGLRVPVRFTPERGDDLPPQLDDPDGIKLDDAEHCIIVVLADKRMTRTAGGGTGKAWSEFTAAAMGAAPIGTSPHHVLPVALDEAGFGISAERHVLGALADGSVEADAADEARLSEISLHVAARAIQLLEKGKIVEERPDQIKAPVQLFISHAKADLSSEGDDPARQTMAVVEELPIEKWFDAAKIGTGQEFDRAIDAGIRDSTVMIAFHTDHYGSRPWCRREVLAAKEKGIDLLVVDALREGEERRFPYLGNAPAIRWQFGNPKASARRIIDRAVLEALRMKHNRALLDKQKADDDVVLPSPPEAAVLAYRNIDPKTISGTFLYPDPPLSREELELLNRLAPNAELTTPLTRLAEWIPPEGLDQVAVSISQSDDIARYGLSDAHQATLSDEIHLYLLLAGLRIGYGGGLKGDLEKAENFTLRLFELVRGYARLAEQVGAGQLQPIVNYIPWPLILDYGDAEWDLFGSEAKEVVSPRPSLAKGDDELFPSSEAEPRLSVGSPDQRYAWARGLTLMREQMTNETQARVVIGGKLQGFAGMVPGVIEEAWMSLTHQKPLYLVGAFGGCARALADQLLGHKRPEFTIDCAQSTVDNYDAALKLYEDDGVAFTSMERMGQDLAERGKAGLGRALRNGLEDDENIELLRSFHPARISALILRGLARLGERNEFASG